MRIPDMDISTAEGVGHFIDARDWTVNKFYTKTTYNSGCNILGDDKVHACKTEGTLRRELHHRQIHTCDRAPNGAGRARKVRNCPRAI